MLWKKWAVFGKSSPKKISLAFSNKPLLISLDTSKRWLSTPRSCKNRAKRSLPCRLISNQQWPGSEQWANLMELDLRYPRNPINILETWTTTVIVKSRNKLKNSNKITPLQKLSSTMWPQLQRYLLTLKGSFLRRAPLQLFINQIKAIITTQLIRIKFSKNLWALTCSTAKNTESCLRKSTLSGPTQRSWGKLPQHGVI